MKEKDDASQELAKILDVPYDDLLEKGFHKILAYGVAGAMATPPRPDAPQPPNVELRIRQRLGDEEYKRLLEKKFALIIASLFQVMQEDGTSDRFLSKDPSLAATAAYMRDIVEVSHSTGKIPDPLRPYFKVKVVLNAVHHLCGRLQYDDTRLWTPAMFTFVTRRLFDTMDPALGSLSACAVVRKIRLLVCLANPKSIDGYALEMVIHGLKPYIVDTYCAEDAVGVVQYLLDQGKGYLSTQPAFVIGTFLSILASLRAFLSAATGQEDTQVQLSLNIAQSFHIWLGDYLTGCHFPELNEMQNQLFQAIVESAMGFRLHGNASSGTKESDLLRHLLDDDRNKNKLLDDVSRGLAFSLVCSGFQKPVSFRDDIFGSDEESVARSRVSYAASGDIHSEWTQETELEKITDLDTTQYDLDIIPKAGIFQLLLKLLLSDDRLVIGLAEATLETIFFDESRSPGVATFHYILDENMYKAMKWSILPMSLSENENPRPITSVTKPEILPVDEWVKDLTTAISTNLQEDAVVKNLRPILEKVGGLAKDLFPFVVHILLLHHIKGDDELKMELSELFRDCFRTCSEKTVPHSIILIKTILYLRTQETAQEATKLPRDHWLDVDYLEMARAACICKMFKTSLLFAEIYHSESGNAEFPDSKLLLEIFRNVDDLDSYYGVSQASSLETVLKRFEYEEDGWKSLSFRGANLESHLRLGSTSDGQDLFGVVDAFNTLGMNGLSHAFLQSGTAADASEDTLDNMFRSAWKLEQWDLPCPSSCTTRSATIYRALQSVNNNLDMRAIPSQLDSSFFGVMRQITAGKQTGHSLGASMRTLAMLTEMEEVLVSKETGELEQVWERLQNRNSWMHIGRYSDVEEIMTMRQTTLSSVSKRDHLRRAAGVDIKTARFLEAKALVASCKMARSHKVLQHSLSAATQLSKAVEPCKQVGLDINAVATLQAANVLWDHGQGIASIRMLQALGFDNALGQQSIVVGKAKLLAKLGNWVSEARLEKPDKIMSNYLVFAIDELKENYSGSEAGRVFHEFASFCDQQLQNSGNIEDYQRALKLRQNKEAEVRELEKLMKSAAGGKLEQLTLYRHKAKTWLNLDDAEFNRLRLDREAFLERSISNYLRALAACDDYDHDAVRFCALWLEHSGDAKVNKAAEAPLGQVASRKFVPLMNQLSSRLLESPEDIFQSLLFPLILRICMDHPHHGHYQILALTRAKPKDNISQSRQASAAKIATKLKAHPSSKPLFSHIIQATTSYIKLATQKIERKPGIKPVLRSVLTRDIYSKFSVDIPNWKIPPPTMQIDVRADKDYSGLPVIAKFHPEITIASGISAPKIVTCLASDGRTFKMLFKGGNDDLRQDAIMEQVFEQVSNLLKKSRTTRQRNLSIRNYKVLPLATNAGIIEFVANTIPLYDFLMPAHMSYHPRDWKPTYCRKTITDVQTKTREVRIDAFQRVAAHFRPVMRYFFMHKFNGPDDWFSSRLAYSRSTAAISILGHVLGLGDRHGHNILLDEKSGEVVHIDLGVAFEQGRILPVPEVVPFRLTRDIIDGFGVTRTEGVFRRSCEFTLTVLRNEAYNITTILDVLRYDPLYSWTISPLRMKKMQDQVEAAATGIVDEGIVGTGGAGKKDEESEADRALTVVAKKLSATLSVGATVNELIQVAGDERNLAVLYSGEYLFFLVSPISLMVGGWV
ncbi:unnamed protein product [Tuber melanosporum]|uniref:Serine/threonine-protein kinase TEL1 n=1 Tax=Tuber melanosporum (strain Mel28) TaxID=656061 RepID=D5GH25_TUBMM|nr:uncharacterized protein GSTUM_00007669001 [Tuber melanosporum]CAZ83818.1 unnamed protein product [Tuber melanosporum]